MHLLKCRFVKLLKFVIVIMLIVFSLWMFLIHSQCRSVSCHPLLQLLDEKLKRWQQHFHHSHTLCDTFTRFPFCWNRIYVLCCVALTPSRNCFVHLVWEINFKFNKLWFEIRFSGQHLKRNRNTPQNGSVWQTCGNIGGKVRWCVCVCVLHLWNSMKF